MENKLIHSGRTNNIMFGRFSPLMQKRLSIYEYHFLNVISVKVYPQHLLQ